MLEEDEDIVLDNIILKQRESVLEDKKITVNGSLSHAFTKALAIAFTKTPEDIDEQRSSLGKDLEKPNGEFIVSIENHEDRVFDVVADIVNITSNGKPTNIHIHDAENLPDFNAFSVDENTNKVFVLLVSKDTATFNAREIEYYDYVQGLLEKNYIVYKAITMK